MNWEAISAIAEVVGVLAVIVTVIYLALQVKQSTRSIQGATEQALMSQEIDLYATIAQHANVFRRGGEDPDLLDPDEAVVYQHLILAQMSQFYSGWVQYKRGLIPERVWKAYVEGLKSVLSDPGAMSEWENWKHTYPEDFQRLVVSERSAHPT